MLHSLSKYGTTIPDCCATQYVSSSLQKNGTAIGCQKVPSFNIQRHYHRPQVSDVITHFPFYAYYVFQGTFLSLFLKTESIYFLLFVTFIESFSYPWNTIIYPRYIFDFCLSFLHIEFIISIYAFIYHLHLHEMLYNTGVRILTFRFKQNSVWTQMSSFICSVILRNYSVYVSEKWVYPAYCRGSEGLNEIKYVKC